jgi:hypothetical protein
MSEEPDIVEELRKAERIGQFYKDHHNNENVKNNYEIKDIVKKLFESDDEIDDILFSLWRML